MHNPHFWVIVSYCFRLHLCVKLFLNLEFVFPKEPACQLAQSINNAQAFQQLYEMQGEWRKQELQLCQLHSPSNLKLGFTQTHRGDQFADPQLIKRLYFEFRAVHYCWYLTPWCPGKGERAKRNASSGTTGTGLCPTWGELWQVQPIKQVMKGAECASKQEPCLCCCVALLAVQAAQKVSSS